MHLGQPEYKGQDSCWKWRGIVAAVMYHPHSTPMISSLLLFGDHTEISSFSSGSGFAIRGLALKVNFWINV